MIFIIQATIPRMQSFILRFDPKRASTINEPRSKHKKKFFSKDYFKQSVNFVRVDIKTKITIQFTVIYVSVNDYPKF